MRRESRAEGLIPVIRRRKAAVILKIYREACPSDTDNTQNCRRACLWPL